MGTYVSQRRIIASARKFFTAALTVHGGPCEVVTDRAPALANVIEDLVPAAWHNTGQYENNRVECVHGRLKARLRPMRGVKTTRTASVVTEDAPPSRTSAAATASWQSTPRHCFDWPRHSTNSEPPSDPRPPGGASAWPAIEQRNRVNRGRRIHGNDFGWTHGHDACFR